MHRMEGVLQMEVLVIGLTVATIFLLVIVLLARHDAKS
jgi:hypothetical protein